MRRCALFLAIAWLVGLAAAEGTRASEPRHGLSVFGDLKYPPDFPHFDYVNPDAPKGGAGRMPRPGTFHSLQPFIRQGRAAAGAREIYDTLLTRAWDETSALYGLLAETVELADDKSWIEFALRPEARWHDGESISADDVVFTVEVLKEKGSPREKMLLRAVAGAEKLGPRRVRIHLSGQATRQLPLQIGGELRILPEHYWATREFDKTTLEPPLGSGPYRIAEVDPGRRISYERVRDYWGKDLNVNVGRFNFDSIHYRYSQDLNMQTMAVKGHEVDWHVENLTKTWVTAYNTPAKHRGHLIQEVIETDQPRSQPVRVMNLRQERFQDPRVREALTLAHNYHWINEVLYFHQLRPMRSYFHASDMEHWGRPPPEELELLEPFRESFDPRIFERQWDLPPSAAHGRNRENLFAADRLLKEAGWIVRDGIRVNRRTGEQFEIEFLLPVPGASPNALVYADSLKRLGIRTTIRAPFIVEFQRRVAAERDFDLIYTNVAVGIVPGAELRNLFGSSAADREYTANIAGIKSPAVDSLIEKIISARSRAELVTAARTLDRVLCWGFYHLKFAIYPSAHWVYWNIFGRPEQQPRFATGFPDTWWIDPVKEQMVASGEPIEVDQAAMH